MATRKTARAKTLNPHATYLQSQLTTWAERRIKGGYTQADVRAALLAAAEAAKPAQA